MDDYMVTQLTDKFDFLKRLSKSEIARLKKEIRQIQDGSTGEEVSELSRKVTETFDDFRTQANRGQFEREYADAQEVMKICA